MTDPIFTDADIAEGLANPALGPEYFAARSFMERVLAGFREEHIKPLADEITKEVTDKIAEKVWQVFQDSLLSDTEYNAQMVIERMVNDTVKALLSGDKWAMRRYPLASRYDAEAVRAAIAAHIPDELAKARIADLEAKVASLQKSLAWVR